MSNSHSICNGTVQCLGDNSNFKTHTDELKNRSASQQRWFLIKKCSNFFMIQEELNFFARLLRNFALSGDHVLHANRKNRTVAKILRNECYQ